MRALRCKCIHSVCSWRAGGSGKWAVGMGVGVGEGEGGLSVCPSFYPVFPSNRALLLEANCSTGDAGSVKQSGYLSVVLDTYMPVVNAGVEDGLVGVGL